ncbi:MAG: NAD-dependent epimerase/dehydratase family protein [Candidatus Scalinduaceae bacterium]
MKDYLEFYKDRVILVTGGAGAIGSNLTRKLAEIGAKRVIVLDDLSSAQKWNVPSLSNVLYVEGSVLDEVTIKRVFFEEPEYVFHLAALFANQNSIDHPEHDLLVNGLGTLKLLQYSHMTGIERFIYASSGCSIYGSNSPLPLKEDFVSIHLSSPYQITKMVGELYCNFFSDHYGIKIVRARFFNSYGPGEIPGQYRNVIPNFIFWAMQNKTLPITGTGEETRDFTYVEDIVDGLLRAGYFQEAVGEAMNLASGVETKIIDLANMINDIVGNTGGVAFAERRKWDTKSRLLASVDKANNIIGYEPSTDFKTGLLNTIKWFEEKRQFIDKGAKFGPGISSAVRDFFVK